MNRVAVFIDNSNVFHNLYTVRQSDPSWICLYDPLFLSQKLTGGRALEYVGFYCTQPPPYLLAGDELDKKRHARTIKYYSLIEKQKPVFMKYGDLRGTREDLQEKNLDTQIATDLVMMAALNKYDTAILISNDGDYLSAAQAVKQFNKRIELAFFRDGLSMALRKNVDLTRRLRRSFFQKIDGLASPLPKQSPLPNL